MSPADAPQVAKRLLDFPLTRLPVIFVIYLGLAVPLNALFVRVLHVPAGYAAASLSQGLAIVAALLFVNVYLRGVPFAETPFRLRKAPVLFGAGLVGGGLVMAAIVALLAIPGWYRVTGWAGAEVAWPLVVGFGLALVNVIFQEAFARGMIFATLEEAFGTYAAIAADTLLFGLMHLSNAGTTLPQALAVGLEFGVLACASYALTRSLWLPIGLHLGWNFVQGEIFGLPVSGTMPERSLVLGGTLGPEWATGGAFGPEGGAVAIVVGTVLGLAMLLLARRAGQIRVPAWLRRVLDLSEDTSHIRRRLK
jgi:membrane protease YdiL (CAAX protease family)